MQSSAPAVSIHPYFKVHSGQLEKVKALLREFIPLVAKEPGTRSYDFTIGGDVVFCRETYVDAEALLAHVAHVGALVDRLLTLSNLDRVEVHGPAAELAKLKEPLAGLKPTWFFHECGVPR
jgi:quinol monooxygenase YgiN